MPKRGFRDFVRKIEGKEPLTPKKQRTFKDVLEELQSGSVAPTSTQNYEEDLF